ncbi:hypothetical protein PFICI_02578 [Pestalotiopsis fici W106-1]|uniref:O-methyltransferase C-terminal domain-containing protein n=1 Tax=Pestalotiopsis fici (strain W106-1 / CGMCC3.15140) TaxID=1229662 RepID=W3XEM4_PESFW|nr:uncharacterized protein PFICI_02578 [Pestalotiopsis fici W106-1]ETS84553.1 hypothetical protein PFICI_02578 [Pestalotiopsis fici W106-1]
MSTPVRKAAEILDSIQLESFANDTERYAAKEAARRLLSRIETPFERGWTLTFETPVLIAALQTLRNLGLWSAWYRLCKENKTADEQSLEHIVSLCQQQGNADINLLPLNVVEETDVDKWRPTAFSLALGNEASHLHHILDFGTDHSIITGVNLPRLLQKYNYHEPLDTKKADNYTDVNGVDFFGLCEREPHKADSFEGLMTALRNHKMHWTEVYDTRKIVENADLAKPLFVDVGGLHGLDTAQLLARHPDLPPDVLFVQDLPNVVAADIEHLDARIVKQAYDFFTPQPLVGARAYFFHAVCHDWPDAECVRILQNAAAAMTKGYSKLLIYEIVLPARDASSLMTTLDLQLMNIVSGLERTEGHWKELLAKAGFKVVSIARHFRAVESVIAAELA